MGALRASFGAVPSIITLGLPGRPLAPLWATAAGALLGVGAHLANVLPDIEADLATASAACRTGSVDPLGRAQRGAAARDDNLLVLGPGRPGPARLAALGLAAAITAGALVRAAHPGSRAVFRAVLVVAVVDVALLVASGSTLAPS